MAPGQATPPHDHESWGCAATLQGRERNRNFSGRCPDQLTLLGEQEAEGGEGYLFEEGQIHQAVGADPNRVTISLHFLIKTRSGADRPRQAVTRSGRRATSRRRLRSVRAINRSLPDILPGVSHWLFLGVSSASHDVL